MNDKLEKLFVSVKYIKGTGSPSARIVFVGEAPGREEEELGEPFVGRSGQLLNKWIGYLGLKRVETYITNVVKVRPHENRTPNDEEIKSWLPILHQELIIVAPQFIVTLGKTAEKALQMMGYDDFAVLYHPAYILRSPEMEHVVLKRLNELKEKIQGAKSAA